jgi:hypothetical protein
LLDGLRGEEGGVAFQKKPDERPGMIGEPDFDPGFVLLCTDPGDLVLDPRCGSGTTGRLPAALACAPPLY